jgi:hypothetical protein
MSAVPTRVETPGGTVGESISSRQCGLVLIQRQQSTRVRRRTQGAETNMGLITCPACQARISSTVIDCPECGRPIPDAFTLRGDATGGLIPYKNAKALASYYCGVFGLISCFLCLGLFGIVPIILGFLGLRYARQNPEARGQVHAIVGIVLGLIEVLTFLTEWGFVVVSFIRSPR